MSGFPSFSVTPPGGINPATLRLVVSQIFNAPNYVTPLSALPSSYPNPPNPPSPDQYNDFYAYVTDNGNAVTSSTNTDTSSQIAPQSTTATSAAFALSSQPFSFETNFTQYQFTFTTL